MKYDDDVTIDSPCPGCGHNTVLKLNDILAMKEYTCENCKEVVAIDAAELKAGLEKIDKELLDLLGDPKLF